jgi:hypothetical protein
MPAKSAKLDLTRKQILAFRRMVQGLDDRRPASAPALQRAAWAGLQDSMPRAALLSLHARLAGMTPGVWDGPPFVQVWGPRYSVYVVDAGDAAVFTLGRLPDTGRTRGVAEALADRLATGLGGTRLTQSDAARVLGAPANALRYATLTGRVRIRWDGAKQATLWMVPPPAIGPHAARLELARRYLHVFGPSTPAAFAAWAGIAGPAGRAAFDSLGASLIPVRTPFGDAWILAADEERLRRAPGAAAPARLLPSGDAYFLLQRPDQRALLVENAADRDRLWTPRVWPGALLVGGVIAGTWRRAGATVAVETWRRLSSAERHAVEAEAAPLPLQGLTRGIVTRWER